MIRFLYAILRSRPGILLLALSLTGCEASFKNHPKTLLGSLLGSDITLASDHDFGSVAVSSSNAATLTVTNSSSKAMTALSAHALSAPFSFQGGTFPGSSGTCGSTLAAGASCTVVITYSPSSGGSSSGTVTLTYTANGSAGTLTAALTGNAGAVAQLTLSDASPYNFGSQGVGSTTDHTFTLSYSSGVATATGLGSTALANTNFYFKGSSVGVPGTYPGVGGTCGTSLAVGQNCTIIVTFQPSATGALSDSFTLSYNDGINPQTIPETVNGTGVVPGVSSVTSALADGSYGLGSPITVQVVFTGVVNVTGTPQLTLGLGGSPVANYTSGSGSNTLVFSYTVGAGDSSADLDYAATTSLGLNGGTIK
ncbi:MAG: choice-of-anchor D domain-containing protein, partial [Bdellovibrionota bacterium]